MGSLQASEGDPSFHLGQRLSFEGALCTVRYHGALPGHKGIWLGVEWDDVGRGKHDGTYQGRRYFHCLCSAPTAGSFIRPSRTRDPPRSFLDALRFKYAAEQAGSSTTPLEGQTGRSIPNGDVIEISGKVVKEVGFGRIRQQQAVLQNLRIVLLDGLCVSGITLEPNNPAATATAQEAVAQSCPGITELDLGWNLLETWTDVARICLPLKKLQILKASGLRLHQFDLLQELEEEQPFRHVTELHINENLLQAEHIPRLICSRILDVPRFPNLKVLSLSQNRLCHFRTSSPGQANRQLSSATTLILDNNLFTSLAFLPDVAFLFPDLRALSLQGNQVSSIELRSKPSADEELFTFPQLESLNLSHNLIQDYSFIDELPRLFPRLTSLRVSHNPFFSLDAGTAHRQRDEILQQTAIPKNASSAPPTRASGPIGSHRPDAAYSLTLARIPTLSTLNHSAITSRDREEGEIYYTFVAEREISAAIANVPTGSPNREAEIGKMKNRFPRYEELCLKYDRPSAFDATRSPPKDPTSQPTHAPGTLGARLIQTHFYISRSPAPATSNPPKTTFSRLIPRTISVYSLKALISRTFDLPALQFRLVYESDELDPVRDSTYLASSWDTWGDWDLDVPPLDGAEGAEKVGQMWKRREVEIKDGTREWGFYVDDGVGVVTIRVEPLNQMENPI